MRRTLLLVFIHGFKGGDNTFERFPEHLRVLVSDALPKLNIVIAVYPTFETRGDLTECVASFKEWLQNRVIDLEVEAGTPSPTIDPSVRVVLVGHSMGGIVAAETLLSIARDHESKDASSARPEMNRNQSSAAVNTAATSSKQTRLDVPEQPERPSSAPPGGRDEGKADGDGDDKDGTPPHSFLFPFIQGILAFDTPFLGVHPGVVAHGAESHYNTASAAYSAYNSASKFFGFGGAGAGVGAGAGAGAGQAAASSAASNAARSGAMSLASQAAAKNGGWGKYAMYAGGAAALAGAGAGAYYNRNHISSGWNWVGSHLVFVGCLARGAELSQRVESVVRLSERHGIGFVDFYTRLGSAEGKTKVAGQLLGEERTFCVVPKEAKEADGGSAGAGAGAGAGGSREEAKKRARSMKGRWIETVNSKSADEVTAHRAMFTPGDFPGYYAMSDRARNMVVEWVDKGWYEASTDNVEVPHVDVQMDYD